MSFELPDWVTFPEDDWVQITPLDAGLDPEKFGAFIAGLEIKRASFGGEDHSGNKYGAVITRGGYLVQAWGDRNIDITLPPSERLSHGRFSVWQSRTDESIPTSRLTNTGPARASFPTPTSI